jgi:predicted cobalt transporter CbtA
MERKLVLRGLLAGLAGGLVAFVFARIFTEPLIQTAIDYESGRDAAQQALDRAVGLPAGEAETEVFSRAVQAGVGIGVGTVLFGAAMGLAFAFVYTFCLGRVGRVRPRTLSLLVAGAGFVGLYLVPFLKYPANPPAIGHGDTLWDRANLYLVMVGCSVAIGVGAVVLGQRLQRRLGTWNATLLALGGYVVAIGVVMALLPQSGEFSADVTAYGHHATETPLPLTDSKGTIVFPGFPADTLAGFRLYSLAAQALLWATIGLVFAPLAERLLAPATTSADAADADAAVVA